jgi:hypothetical protein
VDRGANPTAQLGHCPCLDLPDPLAGDAELHGEALERQRRIDQPARLEDVAFAVVEDFEGQA